MSYIFEFTDYKSYLNEWIIKQPNRGRGLKSKLAHSLKCRLAYLSRVLNGDADLSPEQALLAARFLGLSPVESRFFRLLADYSRAGSAALRDALAAELKEIKELSARMSERLNMSQEMNEAAQAEYYSSWQISAAHLAMTIPKYRSVEALSKLLHVPSERVGEILGILKRCHLVTEKNGQLVVINQMIHGDQSLPNASRHLANWRQRAIESVQYYNSQNFHYSAVVSVSKRDFAKIRESFIATLEKAANVIRVSPAEELTVLNLDWFAIT